jgi:segregation and condensation protein B
LLGTEVDSNQVQDAVDDLVEKYEGDFAFQILPIAGGYQFFTKSEFERVVSEHIKNKLNKRLSTGQLETLSIIAYKQPVSKTEIEQIRGVNCDYVVQKLLEKELVVISGRSESVGKPILYSISDYFLNYFGLNSVSDMPKLKEVEASVENVIGSAEV